MHRTAIGAGRLGLALALCAGVIAGCGSDSGGSATTGGGGSAPAGKPVKVGLIANPVELRTNIAAVEAAIHALNERGGLDGRPVELVHCDDKANPNVTSSCGRKMVDEKVIAMVGGGNVNGNLLVPIFRNAKIASIGATAADPQQLTAAEYFYFTAGEPTDVIAAYSGQAGLKTTVFAIELPDTQALLEPTLTAAKEAGTPMLTTVEVPVKQADYAPVIQSGKPDEANAAMLVVSPSQEPAIVQTARSEGWEPTWLLESEPQDPVVEAMGGTATNVVYPSPFPALVPESEDPDVRRYLDELQAAADDGVEAADQALAHPTYTEAEGWLAVQVLEQMVKDGEIKELTAPAVLAALQNVKSMDVPLLDGWVPNESGPQGRRGGNAAFNLIEVIDGKATSLTKAPVTADELISGEVSVPAPTGAS